MPGGWENEGLCTGKAMNLESPSLTLLHAGSTLACMCSNRNVD